jgi:hypothetical protein
MNSSELSHLKVAVALIVNANQQVLLTLNERWGMFTLPMTKRHRGAQGYEPIAQAGLRAMMSGHRGSSESAGSGVMEVRMLVCRRPSIRRGLRARSERQFSARFGSLPQMGRWAVIPT